MIQAKQTTALLFAMSFAFLLGWTANGYKIYSGFYEQSGNMMKDMAIRISK